VDRVNEFGVAIDLDSTASDPERGFLIWIEPAPE